MSVIVIGNGESRLQYDLENLNDDLTAGCNALYDEYHPDYLFAVDPDMIQDIKSNYDGPFIFRETSVPTRFQNSPRGLIERIPGRPEVKVRPRGWEYRWSTGPTAISYMAHFERPDTVYLLGFDLYSDDGKFNNVYAGRQCYKEKSSDHADYTVWVGQISKLLDIHQGINFVRVGRENDTMPAGWQGYDNIEFIGYDKFREIRK